MKYKLNPENTKYKFEIIAGDEIDKTIESTVVWSFNIGKLKEELKNDKLEEDEFIRLTHRIIENENTLDLSLKILSDLKVPGWLKNAAMYFGLTKKAASINHTDLYTEIFNATIEENEK